MRTIRAILIVTLVGASIPLLPGRAATACKPILKDHAIEAHASAKRHRRVCGMTVLGSLEVSKVGGLGSIDTNGRVAAIVERDEGTVAIVDLVKMRVVGRYQDEVDRSLDGDVSFSDDGDFVFYARQTSNFDEDGIHVLDVTDKSSPRLTMYHPAGGAFRLEYYRDGTGEWLVVLDAIEGLVVYRFVRESGTIAKVFQDATPALKVGGPASAGVFIDRKDARSGAPLMYVTTGRTGLQIYNLSDPAQPRIVGEWDGVGLADVKVKTQNGKRLVYAATEYWFAGNTPPAVVVLDAGKLDGIKKVGQRRIDVPVDDTWRAQGLVIRRRLFVAHSHAGLVEFNRRGRIAGVAALPAALNEGAGYRATPYAMDVTVWKRRFLVTDAATGRLWKLLPYERRAGSRN